MYQILKTDCLKLVKLLGLISSQHKRKTKLWYDENAKERNFKPGDRVLAFLPIPEKPLQARYYSPYTVGKKSSDVNYIVNTPGRRKQKQLCYVNMLKQYIDRDSSSVTPISVVSSVPQEQREMNSLKTLT